MMEIARNECIMERVFHLSTKTCEFLYEVKVSSNLKSEGLDVLKKVSF